MTGRDETQRQEVVNAISEIVEQIIYVPSADAHIDENTDMDLGIDSLSITEITLLLRDKFGIESTDDALSNIRTLCDVINYIYLETVRNNE